MIVVFAGPTISHEEITEQVGCVCLPPVSQGDILLALRMKPDVIAIVDGYFEGVPSVWHKEILYAMDQGVVVYGSSSMGALRAAELSAFGMLGIGQIYTWFNDGILTDDDEVAVLHGPEETGFVVASEPMVNIRATIGLAENRGIINKEQMHTLLALAKGTFYKQRSWRRLFEQYENTAGAGSLTSEIKDWLVSHRVDLKKQDATELLAILKTQSESASEINSTERPYHFEWTQVWDALFREHRPDAATSKRSTEEDQMVLNQLRLHPERFERYCDKALLVWLCSNPNAIGESIDELDVKEALRAFKRHNQLTSRKQVIEHAEGLGLSESELVAMLRRVAVLEQYRATAGNLHTEVIEQLKFDGVYTELADTARRKRCVVELVDSEHRRKKLVPAQVLGWYFGEYLGTTIPRRIEQHMQRIGVEDRAAFDRLIMEEYLYCQSSG